MKLTGRMYGRWSELMMDSGDLVICNDAEISSVPTPDGMHPHNWHQGGRHGYQGCPYCNPTPKQARGG